MAHIPKHSMAARTPNSRARLSCQWRKVADDGPMPPRGGQPLCDLGQGGLQTHTVIDESRGRMAHCRVYAMRMLLPVLVLSGGLNASTSSFYHLRVGRYSSESCQRLRRIVRVSARTLNGHGAISLRSETSSERRQAAGTLRGRRHGNLRPEPKAVRERLPRGRKFAGEVPPLKSTFRRGQAGTNFAL